MNTSSFRLFPATALLAFTGSCRWLNAKQPNNFGLPAVIAEQVKARCAKTFPFYDSQVSCIEMEAKAYQELKQPNNFCPPAEIA